MKSPNWTPEELQLALELYLDRDMQWHSKISNNTWEIMALSELLKGLNVIDAEKDDKFRSPSSIRLKFANFKSLDERYGNSAMSNVGNLDKAIWNQYHSDYQILKNKCQVIIETHYKGKPSAHLEEYLARFEKTKSTNGISEYADKLFNLAKELRAKAVTCEDIDFSQKVMDECYGIIKGLKKELQTSNTTKVEPQEKKKSHAGVNQEKIGSEEKIGRHVRNTIKRLIEENLIDEEVIIKMQDDEWSREVLHLGHPFMIRVTADEDLNKQLTDVNGYVRYWKDIFVINDVQYCFCKEWYESQRKYFDKWVSELGKRAKVNLKADELTRLLLIIKNIDEKKVCINVAEVMDRLKDVDGVERAIDDLLNLKLLARFQGSIREVVVEDYDLLYAMIENPDRYV